MTKLIGIRAIVRQGSTIESSIVMGATAYEPLGTLVSGVEIGIGENCVIRNAIIDLDARVGAGTQIINAENVQEYDGDNYSIRGGVVVVPRGAILPPGTVI